MVRTNHLRMHEAWIYQRPCIVPCEDGRSGSKTPRPEASLSFEICKAQGEMLRWSGSHIRHGISTGGLEGFNNKIKVERRVGYGYCNEDYANAGYLQGKNFIVTFETSKTPLETKYIDALIKEYLK